MASPVVLTRTIAFRSGLGAVRAALADVPGVVGCIPGAMITGTNPDGTYAALIGVTFGDTGVRFTGTVRATSADAGTVVVSATGRDGPGSISATGEIKLSLAAAGEGTAMDLSATFDFSGILAPLGRSATKIVGPRLLESFGSCLVSKVDGSP